MRQTHISPLRYLPLALVGLLGLGFAFPATAKTAVRGAEPTAREALLKEKEHKKLGIALQEWFEASRDKKNIAQAREELDGVIKKAEKKLKGRSLLSSPLDFGQALWFSKDYGRTRGVRKGKVAEASSTVGGFEANYAVHVPKKYTPKKVAYPLILSIADPASRPQDHLNEEWVNVDLRANAIIAAVEFPEDAALWTKMGSPGAPGGIATLLITLLDIMDRYSIDFDKIFLAGHGKALSAATSLASTSPERFAGFIGRSGDVEGEIDIENFRNLPTYFAGGGAGVTKFSEAVGELGHDNSTVSAEGTEEDIWAWVQNQKRNTTPEEVTFVPGTKRPLRVFWLEVPSTATDQRQFIRGKVDRATNTITITGKNVTSVTVYFNDDLVDLDLPIKVICNGVEHTSAIPRNLTQAVNLQVKWGVDAGKVYVAFNQYDLPALDD